MKEIMTISKIDNSHVELEYDDNTKQTVKVHPLESRQCAVKKAEELTKLALKKDNAYENLKTFINDFDRLRNYEIENYLYVLSQKIYRIRTICPFNGFSWFK